MSRIKNSKLYIDQEVLLTREGIDMDQEISLHRSISISEIDGTALLHSVQELIPRCDMRWQNKLTKKELAHVRETTNRCTLAEFKSNFQWQECESLSEGGTRCWGCWSIARKLGVIVCGSLDAEEERKVARGK